MIKNLTIAWFLLIPAALFAQAGGHGSAYRIVGSNIVLYLKKSWPREDQEKLLEKCGMAGLSLDTLWRFGSLGRWEKDGWKLTGSGKSYRIYKSVSSLSGDLKWDKDVFLPGELYEKILLQTTATFGSNKFKKKSIFPLTNGLTRFFLEGNTNAKDVFLSGTFNTWSTLANKMTRTDSGWVCDVPLKAGKHCYKFIVGGRWLEDPHNDLKEADFYGGRNSIYFLTNFEFKLAGHTTAKEVFVAGSFNQWKQNNLPLKKTVEGWSLPVFLKEGWYEYKFIVDDQWQLDPHNPDSRDNGNGIRNSVLRIGNPFNFLLSGYSDAQKVILSGDFNAWSEKEMVMNRTSTGWSLPLVLAPGNYQYKFIVDGQWILDPQNPQTALLKKYTNSIISIKPNHTFSLADTVGVQEVRVSGNFNDWTGYTMKKIGHVWTIDLFLPPGKCLYKFIVNGNWIIDPKNSLWEENKYNTGNSVLWIPNQ
jgi:hypothetical protein